MMPTVRMTTLAGALAVSACAGPMGPDGPMAPPVPGAPQGPSLAAPPCDLTVWPDERFWGGSAAFTTDQKRVGLWWNDRISSIEIRSGVWQFFMDNDYLGASVVAGPGRYASIGPVWNDQISSFRCLGQDGYAPPKPWPSSPPPQPRDTSQDVDPTVEKFDKGGNPNYDADGNYIGGSGLGTTVDNPDVPSDPTGVTESIP